MSGGKRPLRTMSTLRDCSFQIGACAFRRDREPRRGDGFPSPPSCWASFRALATGRGGWTEGTGLTAAAMNSEVSFPTLATDFLTT